MKLTAALLAGLLSVVGGAVATGCRGTPQADRFPDARSDAEPEPTTQGDHFVTTEKATFAAGCFWGVQAAFDEIPGVVKTTVGYTGGHTPEPTYKQVCTHTTGHAEAVLVEFDPTRVSYQKLVESFFGMHDPTTLNRQGPDVGDQYRSAVFVHSPDQARVAREVRDRLAGSGRYPRPIVTEITDAPKFWPAEEYHQKYFQKTGRGACHSQGS